jgi:hypothetical protein
MKKIFTLSLSLATSLFAISTLNAQTWGSSGNDAICVTGSNTRIVVEEYGPVWIGDGTGTLKYPAVLLYVDGYLKAREVVVNMDD